MAIEDLWDHRARIWRRTSTLGTLREEQRTYVPDPEPSAPNATVRRPTARYGNPGPGLAPIGERKVYMGASTSIAALDLVELLEGPDAPRVLEVDEPPTYPRGHHVELTTRLFNGQLPSQGGGS